MIDPHVHLRDWKQSDKETIKHGLKVAYDAGLDAVFEMPNTSPEITSRKIIEERISLADQRIKELDIKIFHGLYAGVTNDLKQIEEVVQAHKDLFPRVVGLKMFAGNSTGNMGIIKKNQQQVVYETLANLNYNGILAVHCEKESLLKIQRWNPTNPITHTQARPPEAEIESVKDQIKFAHESKFKGTLHICHISTIESLIEIEQKRDKVNFQITCGITPHHVILHDEMMNKENGILLKMNPPLRSKKTQEQMLQALFDGHIDWIETDHAPHKLKEKTDEPFASGIPNFPYYPYFIEYLQKQKMSDTMIENLTHNNIVKTFNLNINNTSRKGNHDLAKEYEFDIYSKKQ